MITGIKVEYTYKISNCGPTMAFSLQNLCEFIFCIN